MKALIPAIALALAATGAHAGNLSTFEEPAEVIAEDTPMGGSNAAWIIPLIAIIAIAAAASSDDGDGDPDPEPEPEPEPEPM